MRAPYQRCETLENGVRKRFLLGPLSGEAARTSVLFLFFRPLPEDLSSLLHESVQVAELFVGQVEKLQPATVVLLAVEDQTTHALFPWKRMTQGVSTHDRDAIILAHQNFPIFVG